MRKWIAGLLAALGIGAASVTLTGDGVRSASAAVVQTVGDTSIIRVTWTQRNADSVFVRWTYPNVSVQRVFTGADRTDEIKVVCGPAVQNGTVALTPKRGATPGAVKSATFAVPACIVVTPPAPPEVDSIRVTVIPTTGGGPIIVPPDTTPTPPPVGDFAVASHMPSTGMQLWFDDDLDNMAQDEFPAPNSQLRWGFRNNGDWRTRDVTTPYSDGVLRVPFSGGGYGDGYGVGLILREEGCWPRMYVVAMEKFEGSGGQPYKVHFNEEKTVFPRTRVCSSGALDNSGPDIAYVGGRNGHDVEVQLQNGLGSPRRYQNRPVWYTLGQWHKVEHYMQANTPGRQDGIWRMWIDGQLAAEYTNVDYSANTTEQVGFWGVRWESVRGGGRDNAPTPAGGQFRIYDRLATYVSPTVR